MYPLDFVADFAWRRHNSQNMLTYTGSLEGDNRLYPGLHSEADRYMRIYRAQEWHVKQTIKAMQGD